MEESKNLIYEKIDNKVEKLIKKVFRYYTSLEKSYIKNEIKKAYEFAKIAHEGQFRLSGEPYLSHPVDATYFLLELKPDISTIQACILHDVIEDTPRTYEDIERYFGKEVADLCAGMEKLTKVRYTGEDRTIGSLRKMFVAMADDLRVIFIKLADRLHNMKTLKSHPKKEKRIRIALETLNVYSPIADRLGLYYFKNALDVECFKILEPKEYKKLKRELNELRESRISFKKNAKLEIDNLLKGTGIKYDIDFRVKAIYSVYKKMKRGDFDSVKDLHDLYGLRLVVDEVSDCYKILGLIHNKWTPIPKKFKDYIALPKPNGYRSLHTTVIGLLKNHRQQPTEIQIKTFEMKEHSDMGMAAHFEYKEKGSKIAQDIDWVNELKDLTENLGNNDFMDSLKIDIFKDRIFILTPKGDTRNLPAGSTAIDFAYDIHTDLGNHITLAKVNGKVNPLDKELHNGDVVEIIIDKNKAPNPFWVSFVKTTKAKNCIKSFLKKEDKDLYIERGREILNNYLEKVALEPLDKELSILKNIDGREYKISERTQLLEQIGNFSIPPSTLMKKIFKEKKIKKEGIKQLEEQKIDINENKVKVIIGGENNISYKIGHCCRRKMPEKIVAHINSKGVITIHKRNCNVIKDVNKDRLLPAYYEGEENNTILIDIIFTFKDKFGVLKDLSDILYSMMINIIEINSKKNVYGDIELNLKLELLEYDYLIIDRFIDRVKFKLNDFLEDYKINKVEG